MWCSVVPCWNRPQLNSCSSLVFVALKRRTHGNHLVHRKHESPKSLGIATEEKARVSTLHLAGPWIVSELCTRMCIAGSMYKCITPLESSTRKGLAATAQLGASKNGGCTKKKACSLATIFVAEVEPLWQFCTHPKRGFPSFQSTLLIRWCWSLETVSNVKWRHARGTKKFQDCGETALSLLLSKSWYPPSSSRTISIETVTTGDPPL